MARAAAQYIVVRKLRAGSIFKLLFAGLMVSLVPLGVLCGIAAFFGADTVRWEGETIHGAAALWAGPVILAFTAMLLTVVVGALTCLGLWLLSWFRPIALRVVPADTAPSPIPEETDEPG